MPDDEALNGLSSSSLVWMASMINKDEEEAFEQNLSLLEYLASFTNPEAVEKIRESRDNKSGANDEAFKKVIESLTGLPAPDLEKPNG